MGRFRGRVLKFYENQPPICNSTVSLIVTVKLMVIVSAICLLVIVVMCKIRSPWLKQFLLLRKSNQSRIYLPYLGPSPCVICYLVFLVILLYEIKLSSPCIICYLVFLLLKSYCPEVLVASVVGG